MNYKAYHQNFRARREECLKAFGNKCMRCGIRNRSLSFNSKGELMIVYLHICHVFSDQKMLEDAYIIPLCPKDHWRLDHPRSTPPESLEDWSFIGEVARYFLEKESREIEKQRAEEQAYLAETVCTYISTSIQQKAG